MTEAVKLFSRYLQQRAELGEYEIVFPAGMVHTLRATLAARAAEATPRTSPPRRVATPSTPAISSRPVASDSITAPRVSAVSPTGKRVEAVLFGNGSTRAVRVIGEGPAEARVVIVGDTPDSTTDHQPWPFTDQAGTLLDTLLRAVGVPLDQVYRCTIVQDAVEPSEVPAAGTDAMDTASSGTTMIRAPLILTCGLTSARILLTTEETLGKLRGNIHSFDGTPVVPTYSLAALIRQPIWIRPAWEDFQRLRSELEK